MPGGGSAAALIGAVGFSLLSMVVRYTLKKNNKGVSYVKLSRILRFTERSRYRLRKLISKDESAYLRLSKAIKSRGVKNITALYKSAAEVPLEVSAILRQGLRRCEELCPYCKATLASDLVEAALLLEAGFLSAKLNVEANLGGIKDKTYTKKIRSSLLSQKIATQKAKKRIIKKWQRL